MSSKKEEKTQAAADRIKAAALTAAKGLSRAQAERAAAAAARNVNAYGQKEEGPSRWQEKREAKRQMYLMSTEKAVRLGERKDKTSMSTMGAYPVPKVFSSGALDIRVQERTDVKDKKDDNRSKKSKRKYRSDSGSGSDSEASVFETDSGASFVTGSDYSSEGSSTDYSSSSESEEERKSRRRKKKQKQKKGRRRRYSSSSESSDSDSASDSDSDDRSNRRKSSRHGRRR
ncbi:hypothetical protein GOBAR_AA26852 [Gossypium barbadense]|uniref:Uncharacterized protein n=1 Tax=Gossypium barbadense TaxID=3634 RepID=A0A2P5WRU3_GOSBA|nr:hypothetical protein GOBAR_AA26852 [Gossypium barbadense]